MDNQQPESPRTVERQPKDSGVKKKIALTIVGVVVVAWLVVGAGLLGAWLSSTYQASKDGSSSTIDGNKVISADEADLANLVKKVSPSVVSIITTQTQEVGYYRQEYEGAGTGMIISKDGYILTNKHVVSGSRSITIVASDGTIYDQIELVGVDPLNDVAFLKIKNAKDLPTVELGDSGTVRVGQRVFAIGNSLGQYQNTVTSGIISGLGRPISASLDGSGVSVESLTDLLQTDAAINPGNSGGPLINMSGQVIGINTAIVSDAQSIGFSIPINATKGLIRGVLASGTIQKAYIGVQYIEITPDVRAEFDLGVTHGALIHADNASAVVSGSPAEKSGLRNGDIISKVGDKAVGIQGGLSSLIGERSPGDEVELTIIRDSKEMKLKLTLAQYKS